MTTALQDIEAAAALLKDPGRWTKGALARNAVGNEVAPHVKPAVRFDARGALMRVSGFQIKDKGPAFKRGCYLMITADRAAHLLYKKTLEGVNDTLGHEAVLQVLRRAWAIAKSDPPKEDAFGMRDDRA